MKRAAMTIAILNAVLGLLSAKYTPRYAVRWSLFHSEHVSRSLKETLRGNREDSARELYEAAKRAHRVASFHYHVSLLAAVVSLVGAIALYFKKKLGVKTLLSAVILYGITALTRSPWAIGCTILALLALLFGALSPSRASFKTRSLEV